MIKIQYILRFLLMLALVGCFSVEEEQASKHKIPFDENLTVITDFNKNGIDDSVEKLLSSKIKDANKFNAALAYAKLFESVFHDLNSENTVAVLRPNKNGANYLSIKVEAVAEVGEFYSKYIAQKRDILKCMRYLLGSGIDADQVVSEVEAKTLSIGGEKLRVTFIIGLYALFPDIKERDILLRRPEPKDGNSCLFNVIGREQIDQKIIERNSKPRYVDGDLEPLLPSKEELENTVEGIDSDLDGIRDDLEVFINNNLKTRNQRMAARQYVKDSFRAYLSSSNCSAVKKNSVSSFLSGLCFETFFGDNLDERKYYSSHLKISQLMINTDIRKENYKKYLDCISTDSDLPSTFRSIKAYRQYCRFDYSKEKL